MSSEPEKLLSQLMQGRDDDGAVANALLNAFFRGYPLHNLLPLLQSLNDDVVANGVWLASELGARAAPVFDSIIPLLQHGSSRVRFNAIDVVLVCASASRHGEALASTVALTLDENKGVRWCALGFIARASREQLRASIAHQRQAELAALTSWLVDQDEGGSSIESILAQLKETHPLRLRFAAVAAVRQLPETLALLELAAQSADAECASFAHSELRLRRSKHDMSGEKI
jgi:hypothetical protein